MTLPKLEIMKTIIVEDEKLARQNLIQLLQEIDSKIEVLAQFDTVKETVVYLKEHKPDLIFLDIHLADDLSFRIFDHVEVNIPIIFTTAYDQYTLNAFKVNSVDYLLKPINKHQLSNSLLKYKKTKRPILPPDYQKLIEKIEKNNYQERFIVSRGDKIMSVTIDEIAYFEGEDRYVYLTKKDGSRYIVDYKLSELESQLHPKNFFRLNRSFITHFKSIDKIINLSKSRLKVELNPKAKREIIVSAANMRKFKKWLNQ